MSDEVILSEKNGILSLHLGNDIIQSAMSLKDPSQLVLSYSQAMVASLLFLDQFTFVVHLGLGAGSLVRWFDTFFPEVKQIAVEINPKIIGIARSMFQLNQTSKIVDIILDDAFNWLPKQKSDQFDLILVDIFDADGMLPQFVSVDFFDYCLQKLTPQGSVVFNWWQGYPYYSKNLQDLRQVFKNEIVTCPATTYGNIAVMGFKRKLPSCSKKVLRAKANHLKQKTNVNFSQLLSLIEIK
ncbi:MAG: polyamine aminopropyltransferase [Neisseriaceae bacterium]|nr:MAG: polyamine aminopropyltransferase [Neisseriaceae bacterium]